MDGLIKIPALVKKAKEYEMPAVAITDHGSMYGVIEFYKKCVAEEIKPILGCEIYVAARSRFNKEPHIDARRYHLTLLAKDNIGYQNLIKIVTKANLEGYYYKPRADKELLLEHHEGPDLWTRKSRGRYQGTSRNFWCWQLLSRDHAPPDDWGPTRNH